MISSSLRITFIAISLLSCLTGQALSGNWRGNLEIQGHELPLVFNFTETADGKTDCTMDSPMQNAKGILCDVSLCTADSIVIECRMIGASYEGKVTQTEITGTFKQMGMKFPLVLTPDNDISERRPQTPKAPFPYKEVPKTFTAMDGVSLSGSLVIPDNPAPGNPMVVMVTGSGPQNRDEELFEHRPFAVIADLLARNGIASFRYDDRGVGESGGDFSTTTTFSLRDDAAAALAFAKSVNLDGMTGMLGHSEGGTIAVMLAGDPKQPTAAKPDFVISMAGMVVPGKQTLLEQNRHSLEMNKDKLGLTDKDIDNSARLVELIFNETVRQWNEGVREPIDVIGIAKTENLEIPQIILDNLRNYNDTRSEGIDALIAVDPTESLKHIGVPLLALNGSKDTQVNASENLKAFCNYTPTAKTMELEGLNHLLQPAVTGELDEYAKIPVTISPDAVKAMVDFILSI